MSVWAREILYKVVVQTVIFYGRKSWVITGTMMKVLEAFHHQIVRRLRGICTVALGRKVGNVPQKKRL